MVNGCATYAYQRVIPGISKSARRPKVYNFQVEEYHTYYISSIGIIVHNSCKAQRIVNIAKSDSPIWSNLDVARNGLKRSGSGRNLRYYSWDHLHNEMCIIISSQI